MDRDNLNNFNDDNTDNFELPEEGDFGKTQEMDSLRTAFGDEARGITPREEFTDMNSADDMSRTLLMDSVPDDELYEDAAPISNLVKRRKRRKKKQTNHVRTMGQVFLGVVISVAAVCIGSILAFHAVEALRDFTGMAKESNELDVSITEDTTVEDIITMLDEGGIILKPTFFKAYINMTKSGDGFLVGTHTIRSNMSYGNIITMLKTPKEYTKTTVTIMFPEGSSAADVARLLEENRVCRAVDFEKIYRAKTNIDKYDFEDGIPDDPNRFNVLEGYLWPDTYEFYVIDDMDKYPTLDTTEYALTAAETMLKTFQKKITKSMYERMEDLGMTLDEVIILASIIQREGNAPENFAIISSVFHNRLNNPAVYPHFESDATRAYINQYIRPVFDESEAEKLQAIVEAYDTYQCDGFPIGAICNPGMDAIRAALYPDSTDYYYFLVDSDGIFYYAQTFDQHQQNIIAAGLR